MEGITLTLLLTIALAVFFDYVNGFHDTANAIATSVATKALRPQYAVLMAAAFNFIGAFAGTAVAKTIGAGLVNDASTTQAIVAAALIGAIVWNLITWRLGLPSSSSHALIGGLLGATIVGAGFDQLNLSGIWNKVIVPLVTSPIIGFTFAFALVILLFWIFRRVRAPSARRGLPQGAAPLGRLHGVRPRLQRCPEDDGHHHPGAGRRGHPAQRRHHPVGGDRPVRHHDQPGDGSRRLADHEDDGPQGGGPRAHPRLRGRDGRRPP